MSGAKILVVEDESIIAKDIQNMLKNLGYEVPAIAFTAEEAIEKAAETRPDLVLMDIRLRGDMDGIKAAEQIRSQLDVPVVYLTAYADADTLERAKLTEPFGYIVKPFEERDLHTTVEVALYRHELESKLKEKERIERHLRQELEERNQELERRIQELTALNRLFQEHLNLRFETERSFGKLVEEIQRLATEAQRLLQELEQKKPSLPKSQ